MVGALHTVSTTTDYTTTGFVDDDYFIINSGGNYTADISKKAGADCNINVGGVYNVDPGVSALFNNTAAFELWVNEGGEAHFNGTSGSGVITGGDGGQDADRFLAYRGGYIYAIYTTFQNFSHSGSFYAELGGCFHFRNCTFANINASAFTLNAGTTVIMEDCTFSDYDITSMFSSSAATIVLKDTTLKATGNWMLGSWREKVTFIGDVIWDWSASSAPPDETNDFGTFVEDYTFFNKLTLDEGNNLEDCTPTIHHPSQPEAGWLLRDSNNGTSYSPYLTFEKTDGSGDIDIYLLKRTYFNGVGKSWSDSGQAQTGDNDEFTIGLIKPGYDYNTTTAWADDGTASITLSAVSGGGGGCKLAGQSGGMVG